MRDWLAVIIFILILGILIDGIRRMRIARKYELKLSKNAEKADLLEMGEGLNSEFPSGKARVAKQRDPEMAQALNQTMREKYEAARTTRGAPQRMPEKVTLGLDESVPMLMDSVHNEDDSSYAAPSAQEGFLEVDRHAEPSLGSLDELDSQEEVRSSVEQSADEHIAQDSIEEKQVDSDEPEYVEPDEVLIVNVMAKQGEYFYGPDLINVLTELKLKLGDMDIFHRHVDDDGDAPVLYSMANMVVPGTFNLAQMRDFKTPGLSFFLGLPVPKVGDSLAAYDDMVVSAKVIAECLGGELKDENRSVMTQQTIEHGKLRVIEYERKKKLNKA